MSLYFESDYDDYLEDETDWYNEYDDEDNGYRAYLDDYGDNDEIYPDDWIDPYGDYPEWQPTLWERMKERWGFIRWEIRHWYQGTFGVCPGCKRCYFIGDHNDCLPF